MSRLNRKTFRFYFLLASLTCAVLCLAMLVVFGVFLQAYEAAPAKSQAQQVLSELEKGNYSTFVRLIRESVSPFERDLEWDAYLEEKGEGTWNIQPAEGAGEERFHFYRNGEPYGTLLLAKEREAGLFGLSSYVPVGVEDVLPSDFSITVTVLAGQQILVNGVAVSEDFVTERRPVGEIADYFLVEAGDQWLSYTIPHLHLVPEVKVLDDAGEELDVLQNGQDYQLAMQDLLLCVPSSADVSVGGIPVGEAYRGETHQMPGVEGLPDGYFEKPCWQYYRFVVFAAEPKLSVTTVEGRQLPLVERDGVLHADLTPADRLDELTQVAIDYVKRYCLYNTGDTQTGDPADQYGKAAFLKLFLQDVSFYARLKRIYPYYFTNHVEYWFDDFVVENVLLYTEDCYSCDVSVMLNIRQYKSSKPIQYWTPLSLTFLRVEGQWAIGDLTIGASSYTTLH